MLNIKLAIISFTNTLAQETAYGLVIEISWMYKGHNNL